MSYVPSGFDGPANQQSQISLEVTARTGAETMSLASTVKASGKLKRILASERWYLITSGSSGFQAIYKKSQKPWRDGEKWLCANVAGLSPKSTTLYSGLFSSLSACCLVRSPRKTLLLSVRYPIHKKSKLRLTHVQERLSTKKRVQEKCHSAQRARSTQYRHQQYSQFHVPFFVKVIWESENWYVAIAGVVPARYIYIRKCQFVPTLLTSGPLRQFGSHDKAKPGQHRLEANYRSVKANHCRSAAFRLRRSGRY